MSSGPIVALALEKADACGALQESASVLVAKFGSGAELIKPTMHASADARAAHTELKLFFPRTFKRDSTVAIAPAGDAIFAAAMKEGFLALATREVSFTPEQAAILAAGSADPAADVAALTAGPLVATLLERPFAVEALSELRSATTVHVSSSPTAALTEAAGLFGAEAAAVQTTFAFVKPDAFERAASVLAIAEASGFSVLASTSLTLTKAQAAAFYAEHEGKPFYDDLVAFMTSGPALAMVLQRPCAIAAWRSLLGPTNSDTARADAPLSLRACFGTDGRKNACHGSDSAASAAREAGFFFPQLDQMQTTLALLTPDGAAALDAALATAARAGLAVTNLAATTLSASRAADLLRLLGDEAPPPAPAAAPPAPLISAVCPGVAVQLYNPSAADIPLDGYTLVAGAHVASLAGKVAPTRGVFVAYDGDAAPLGLPASEMHKTRCALGANSLALLKDGVALDLVGSLDAGASSKPWAVAGVPRAAALHTLVRKAAVAMGNASPWGDAALSSQGVSAASSEWELLPKGSLGAHSGWSLADAGSRAAWAPAPPPAGSHEAAVAHLTSGPVTAIALSGKGAVARWSALMGPTNPLEAKVRSPGCLRARFGADATQLVGYAFASAEAVKFFFPATARTTLPDAKEVKAYVQQALMPTLSAGLVELCQAKPANPTEWLANWLVANNPTTPAVY